MSTLTIVILAIVGGGLLAAAAVWLRTRGRGPRVARVAIVDPPHGTVIDGSGAVRTTQAADLEMTESELDSIWSPLQLERLARTYWRFLTRCTLGLVRVKYTPQERAVALLVRPFVLLRFQRPEYEMDARRGVVRWRIEDGVLVSARGRGGNGYLQIDIRRRAPEPGGRAVARVEVEVANFYPAIASTLSRWVYTNTQSRIHVLVTHGFLRSLARLDLAESRVGRFARDTLPHVGIDEVPDPAPFREPPVHVDDRWRAAGGG